ncbi:MAG: 2,3-diphosphoglycerate-dependent phosphoglycerate mutase, partial [Desulfobacterales bacterium]|nr:2,3-diphosphoglycerate-dependent phosphoglycerate mutase [Desulfobacterales bacterium]
MRKVVFLRHGQSTWNQENRFTGWEDVDLSAQGMREAREAGELLKAAGYTFDVAFTSVLKRAIRTLWLVLDTLDLMWIPVHRTWRLNERHCGRLQGLAETEPAGVFGSDRAAAGRRSRDAAPPALDDEDPRHPRHDPRYRTFGPEACPGSESLKGTLNRVRPYWQRAIVPSISRDRKVLLVAHGGSLQALIRLLDRTADPAISQATLPTGVPLVYELDDRFQAADRYFLGDPDGIPRAAPKPPDRSPRTG